MTATCGTAANSSGRLGGIWEEGIDRGNGSTTSPSLRTRWFVGAFEPFARRQYQRGGDRAVAPDWHSRSMNGWGASVRSCCCETYVGSACTRSWRIDWAFLSRRSRTGYLADAGTAIFLSCQREDGLANPAACDRGVDRVWCTAGSSFSDDSHRRITGSLSFLGAQKSYRVHLDVDRIVERLIRSTERNVCPLMLSSARSCRTGVRRSTSTSA